MFLSIIIENVYIIKVELKKPENFEFISNDNKEWPNPELYFKMLKV